VSEWLENMDYFFLASTKEAFSYATAEAMAKGIKPVIGNWRGADKTWGKYVNKTYKQMYMRFVDNDCHSEEYRQYVADHYDEKRYLKQLDEFVEIEGGDR
jgi:hypothetical protein